MLSVNSFQRIIKYRSKIDPETGEPYSKLESTVKPEQIELIRVEEGNGNYHHQVEINYTK